MVQQKWTLELCTQIIWWTAFIKCTYVNIHLMETLSNPPIWLFKQHTLISNFFLESSIQWFSFMNFMNTQHFQQNFCRNNLFLKKHCNKVGHISAKYESALIFEWLIIKNDGWLLLLIIVRIAFHSEKKISKTMRILLLLSVFSTVVRI